MEIISKTFQELDILFLKENGIYLNATKTAKHFNKKPVDWLKTKETNEYIEAIQKAYNLSRDELIKIIKGGNDRNAQGTWFHKKLIIAFARWLSPDFAVWSDIQIEDILQNGTQIIPKNKNLISVSTENMRKELEALKFILDNFNLSEKEKIEKSNEVFQNLNFIVKLDNPALKKREALFTLTQLLKEFQIPILPKDFNLKLQSFEIIEYSENGWKIIEMRFGENRKYQDKANPKYYKSTFQELLDTVLEL